jgi:hypothetical protein
VGIYLTPLIFNKKEEKLFMSDNKNLRGIKFPGLEDTYYIPNANWEQNDPDAADYIKNRTHYSEDLGFSFNDTVTWTSTSINNGEMKYMCVIGNV